jgi:hypothetical protein
MVDTSFSSRSSRLTARTNLRVNLDYFGYREYTITIEIFPCKYSVFVFSTYLNTKSIVFVLTKIYAPATAIRISTRN